MEDGFEIQEYMAAHAVAEIGHFLDSYPCLVLVTHARTAANLPEELTKNRGSGGELPRGYAWGVDIEASKKQQFWKEKVVTLIKP